MWKRIFIVALMAQATGSAGALGAEPESELEIPEPKVFTTKHTGRFGGVQVKYTAIAGETYIKDENNKPRAAIYAVAYVKDGVDDPRTRPVTFLWNGGPGSSAMWLHMGAFGPKRVDVPSNAKDDGGPPFPIADNPLTILDVTDLVFVDPVGTGYSRPLGKHEGKEFWGVSEDAKAMADFIRQWISDHERWNSPKYIGGESYGTTRAAAVINDLEGGWNDVTINGLILISVAIDFYTSSFEESNELGYVTFLPTMAAVAAYHGKVEPGPDGFEAFIERAREFALTEYAEALLRGNTLPAAERERIKKKLSGFIGISEEYLERSNLRVTERRYYKELLRDRGLTIGRLDGRYTGVDIDNAGETPQADPSFYGIDGAYTAAINDYMSRDLGVKMERQYRTLHLPALLAWKWELADAGFRTFNVNVTPYIGNAMRQNSDLRVLVASGYYDFATPFFDAEMSFMRNGVVPERISYTYYHAGHMMYLHHPSLEQFLEDTRQFILAGRK